MKGGKWPRLTPELLRAYRATRYRVRLPGGGAATIRIGAPLPRALAAWLRTAQEPWGFITAWNPGSRPRAPAANRRAQRRLLARLRRVSREVHAGVGAGTGGWREPSLFALGLAGDTCVALARAFGQHAVVCGRGKGRALLVRVSQAKGMP